jgi:hypothetical protein
MAGSRTPKRSRLTGASRIGQAPCDTHPAGRLVQNRLARKAHEESRRPRRLHRSGVFDRFADEVGDHCGAVDK